VRKFRGEFEAAIEAAREAPPGPVDEPPADVPPIPTGVGA
jgi:hypothetical protein